MDYIDVILLTALGMLFTSLVFLSGYEAGQRARRGRRKS